MLSEERREIAVKGGKTRQAKGKAEKGAEKKIQRILDNRIYDCYDGHVSRIRRAGKREKEMTNQEFYEFQTTVEGTAMSYENQPDGTTIITCEDGLRLLVSADGDSRIIAQ